MDLPDILVDSSTLTRKELESLESYLRVMRGEVRLKDAASQRSGKAVTVGSYYRTVQQGKRTMRESITTTLIGLWLGFIKAEDVRRLFETVGKGASNLSEDEIEHLGRVLQALVERIVM